MTKLMDESQAFDVIRLDAMAIEAVPGLLCWKSGCNEEAVVAIRVIVFDEVRHERFCAYHAQKFNIKIFTEICEILAKFHVFAETMKTK